MERTIDPRTYKTLVGFAHDFCTGCINEYGNRNKRMDECYECIKGVVEKHYKEKQPLSVTKNEEGKNIVRL